MALAQNQRGAPKLSPLTRRYLREAQQQAERQKQLGASGYVYSIGSDRGLYLSALIKVGSAISQEKLAALGVRVGTKAGNIWTVRVPAEKIEQFTTLPGIDYIQIDEPAAPMLDSARKTTRVDSVHAGYGLPLPYTGRNVVVGVVDAGFDYGHPTLFDTTGNAFRVRRVWEQKNSAGAPPAGYTYGTEMTDPAAMWAKGTDNGQTHGAHVAGICAGSGFGSTDNSRFRGMAYEADMVFVGITPDKSQWVNTGAADMIDGINYIFRYADAAGKPAVVNLSWGSPLGPRDGSGLFSLALDNLTGAGHIFVCSAGNNGDNRIHVQKTFTPADTMVRTFLDIAETPVGKKTWVDIWGDTAKTFCVQVTLYRDTTAISTTGLICLDDSVHSAYLIGSNNDTCFVDITTSSSEFNLKPRAFLDFDSRVADSIGIAVIGSDGTIDMWNSFVYNTSGYYGAFSSHGRKGAVNGNSDLSISDIASSKSAITIGAYASKISWTSLDGKGYSYSGYTARGRLVPFSSHGPTADGRVKPDITGPGMTIGSSLSSYDTSFAPTGSEASALVERYHNPVDGRDYPYGMLSGTSMSSPAVSGIVALMLQANPKLSPEQIKEIFAQTAIKDNLTGPLAQGPTNTWGNGKVNAYGAVQRAIQLASVAPGVTAADCAVYPNPSTGLFTIAYTSIGAENVIVEIHDLLGQPVLSDIWSVSAGYNSRQYDVKSSGSGIYFIRLFSRNGYSPAKVVVE